MTEVCTASLELLVAIQVFDLQILLNVSIAVRTSVFPLRKLYVMVPRSCAP